MYVYDPNFTAKSSISKQIRLERGPSRLMGDLFVCPFLSILDDYLKSNLPLPEKDSLNISVALIFDNNLMIVNGTFMFQRVTKMSVSPQALVAFSYI